MLPRRGRRADFLRRRSDPTIGVLLLASSSAASGCPRLSPEVGYLLIPACPPEFTIEILHDAAFHLDQGDDDDGVRRDLEEARARIAIDKTGAAWARGFIKRIDAALQVNGSARQFQAEVIRTDLHDSGCLPKELHARFHRRLPALRLQPGESPERDGP
jgi:hypothetical protein